MGGFKLYRASVSFVSVDPSAVLRRALDCESVVKRFRVVRHGCRAEDFTRALDKRSRHLDEVPSRVGPLEAGPEDTHEVVSHGACRDVFRVEPRHCQLGLPPGAIVRDADPGVAFLSHTRSPVRGEVAHLPWRWVSASLAPGLTSTT